MNNQRLFDLVRHQRMDLHNANLITDEEYAELAGDSDSVHRLLDYDNLRARSDLSKALLAEYGIETAKMRETIEEISKHHHIWVRIPESDVTLVEAYGQCVCGGAKADGVIPYARIWENHIRDVAGLPPVAVVNLETPNLEQS